MRKFVVLMGLLLLVSFTAAAQDDHSKAEVFGGYSYFRFNPGTGSQGANFNGGIGSVAFNLTNHIGVVGEFGGYHDGSFPGAPAGVSVNGISYLFGPKIYASEGKISPFAQVLFGGVRASCSGTPCGSAPAENTFAMAVGGGLDWNATPHLGIRLGQVEYLMTRFKGTTTSNFANNNMQNNFRYSAGVVFRF